MFVPGTDASGVGAVQIPPTIATEFVLPTAPSQFFRLAADAAAWARVGWEREKEYRCVRAGEVLLWTSSEVLFFADKH